MDWSRFHQMSMPSQMPGGPVPLPIPPAPGGMNTSTTLQGWMSQRPQWGNQWDNRGGFRDARQDWHQGFRDWRHQQQPVSPAGMGNTLSSLSSIRGLQGIDPNSNFGRLWG